jgi:hypothetical protein
MTAVSLEWVSLLIFVADVSTTAIINEKLSAFSQFIKENALMTTYVKADYTHIILRSQFTNTFTIHSFIHSIMSNDRSKASSKTVPPQSAIQSLLLQMTAYDLQIDILKRCPQIPDTRSPCRLCC